LSTLLAHVSNRAPLLIYQADGAEEDPETTPHTSSGAGGSAAKGGSARELAQLETLLAGRMKSLETDLSAARRDLADSRRQEVSVLHLGVVRVEAR
jgi:hypothetical protein